MQRELELKSAEQERSGQECERRTFKGERGGESRFDDDDGDRPGGAGRMASYLDLFEAVMIQNPAAEKTWPLRLQAAVINTKLAGSVCMEDFDSFADIKRGLLPLT